MCKEYGVLNLSLQRSKAERQKQKKLEYETCPLSQLHRVKRQLNHELENSKLDRKRQIRNAIRTYITLRPVGLMLFLTNMIAITVEIASGTPNEWVQGTGLLLMILISTFKCIWSLGLLNKVGRLST